MSPFRESVQTFGPGGLVGVLTVPEARTRETAVVILNSGLIHRVGACRLSVKLARRLAGSGFPAFRFDYAGIGDSPPRRDGAHGEEANLQDIATALGHVEAQVATRRFVLFGLCSGARDAFHAARSDPRVTGIVQIDGFAYRNLRYWARHYGRRLTSPARIVGRLRRLAGIDPPPEPDTTGEDMVEAVWADYPPRREVEAGYAELVERGVRLHVIYTGSWADQYNYRDQFLHMYSRVDFGSLLTLRYLPDAIHVLPDPENQRSVLEGVAAWMEDGATAPGAP